MNLRDIKVILIAPVFAVVLAGCGTVRVYKSHGVYGGPEAHLYVGSAPIINLGPTRWSRETTVTNVHTTVEAGWSHSSGWSKSKETNSGHRRTSSNSWNTNDRWVRVRTHVHERTTGGGYR